MNLAINYSKQAAFLLMQDRIKIDRFKCPDWQDMIAEASLLCPVAVHFNLKAGHGNLANKDWGKITRLLTETNTPYINLHLESRADDFPGMLVDTTDPQQCERVSERILLDVSTLVQRFGAERVIVENVPYRGHAGTVLRPSVEPSTIQNIVRQAGCGLLLDISHARIAAHHLGMDERDYMAQLPVDRLRELHFTGLHNLNGRLQDHLEILDTDWPILDWVLERILRGDWPRPWLLALEYGGVGEKFAGRSDSRVIAEQVPRLYAAVKPI